MGDNGEKQSTATQEKVMNSHKQKHTHTLKCIVRIDIHVHSICVEVFMHAIDSLQSTFPVVYLHESSIMF